jgi:serine/threonine-protein kinase
MQFVKRFAAEALAASKLEHPNIARVIDYGQEPDGLLYLVMELLVGTSLEALLTAEGRLPQKKAVSIAIQACTALAYAHDDGIIHRDVKPENIMLVSHRDDDGQPSDLVKVCDFGLAKLREPDAEHADLTTAGTLCGSPAYMSPEQARGEPLDGRSDVYALGVTLFQCLTGALPHEAETLSQLFLKIMFEPARRPSTVVPTIHPLLDDIVVRALSTNRDARHPTARVLRADLRQALSSISDHDSEASRPGSASR